MDWSDPNNTDITRNGNDDPSTKRVGGAGLQPCDPDPSSGAAACVEAHKGRPAGQDPVPCLCRRVDPGGRPQAQPPALSCKLLLLSRVLAAGSSDLYALGAELRAVGPVC